MTTNAQNTTMEVTTAQLQQMLDRARHSERLRCATEVEKAGFPDVAEDLRGKVLPIKKREPRSAALVPEAVVDGGETDPLDTVDERVRAQSTSVLPPVQHLSDDVEMQHLARRSIQRGVRD